MSVEAPATYDFVIIGGGVCGLTAAWKLAQNGHSVAMLEKSEIPGGMIRTIRDGDWLMEMGPNSLAFLENDEIHQLVIELGLADDMIARPMRDSHRYIWRDGALRQVPVSLLQLIRKSAMSRRTLVRAACGAMCKQTMPDDDISIGAFFSPSLGRKAVDHVIAPAMAGIYAADPFCLSMRAIMPRLHEAAKKSTSLVGAIRAMKQQNEASQTPGGRRMIASFAGGMDTLTNGIARQAASEGAKFLTSCDAANVEHLPDNSWKITATDGRGVNGRHLICALPAAAAAELLQPIAPEASGLLHRFQYAPMITACIGVKESEVATKHSGFGYLAVRNAGARSLGMIWNDRMFAGRAPAGYRLFTVYLGGQIDRAVQDISDAGLLDIVKKDLRLTMKWSGAELDLTRIARLPAAIPLLEVGHLDRVRDARANLPHNFSITGNYIAGVSVPSCMRAGVNLAAGFAAQK